MNRHGYSPPVHIAEPKVTAALTNLNESGTSETTHNFAWGKRSKRHEKGVGLG